MKIRLKKAPCGYYCYLSRRTKEELLQVPTFMCNAAFKILLQEAGVEVPFNPIRSILVDVKVVKERKRTVGAKKGTKTKK